MAHPHFTVTVVVDVGTRLNWKLYGLVMPPEPSQAHPLSPLPADTHAHLTVLEAA
ncbi:hypothetical protein ACGFNQ_07015 [Streptomyces asoensis]|uniref:hypothetical protein n=1 Tax=Streptomyces asoensis TaxID=249586 RepID=UPI003710DA0B